MVYRQITCVSWKLQNRHYRSDDFAACATVFNVVGPKVLGKATTALSEGLMNKINGTGGMDFNYIGKVLLFVLGLYSISAVFSFIQGWIMTGITQKLCYRLRKEISEKLTVCR